MSQKRLTVAAVLALLMAAGLAGAARADDDALCGDRPGKAHANCTVPAGRFQLESDLYDQSWMKAQGQDTTVTIYTSPVLKYGVTDKVDVEVGLIPYQTTRIRDLATWEAITQGGVGDLDFAAKFAVTKQITIMPFVNAPTATGGQGEGGWSGGVRAPMQFQLPAKGWTVSFNPELSATPNEQTSGAHLTHVETVSLNKDVGHGVNLGAELWGQWDYDPAGHTSQASLDLLAAWVPPQMKSVQLDAQVSIGLNHATPDTQLIFGLTKRF